MFHRVGMGDNWERARLDHRVRQSEAIASSALTLVLERGASALTMAAIAAAANVSRQTLYRYYPDIDAVLVGVAELIASHDDRLEAQVLEQPDPAAQLDTFIGAVAHTGSHHTHESAALQTTLPPRAREVLARHEDRIVRVLVHVLKTGINAGVFRSDVEPSADAPLIVGLAAVADPTDPSRAVTLVHRMVDNNSEGNPHD